jgi:iron complex outermembrane receptor protein
MKAQPQLDACAKQASYGRKWNSLQIRTRARTVFFAIFLVAIPAWPQQKTPDITSESIEDLMNIEVTSVSKKEEKLSRVAAAIFVITQEDIRHSGATNIPDLLRMVPGMDVGQIDSNTWAISARGLNEQFSDKLLVLVDGRSVYTQTFGGVFWDGLGLPLEDVERIEVIRGPGGSIWGANAVNGVINIITKKASDTQGGLAVAGGGNVDQGFGSLQYGGHIGKSTEYRVYDKYFNQAQLPNLADQPGGDGWHVLRGGFRVDSSPSSEDKLTVQGDLYGGREGQAVLEFGSDIAPQTQASLGGGYFQTTWNHNYSTGSSTTLQASYDREIRNIPFRDDRGTLTIDFQYHSAWGSRQDVVLGGGYLYTSHLSNSANVRYDPADNVRQIFSSFVQDEIAVAPERVYLTVGSRLEHNEYTGFVAMPNVRVAWQPSQHHTLWAAISSARRMPSSGDTSDFVTGAELPGGPGGLPLRVILNGNPNFKNERLLAYEAGYRAAVSETLTVDFSAFYNVYNALRTLEPQTPFLQTTPPPTVLLLPFEFFNEIHGETHGFEIFANWKATSRWTLSPGYAFEGVHMHLACTSHDTDLFPVAEGGSPDDSAQLRSHWDLGHQLSWDASAYFVDRLRSISTPAYTRADAGITWRPLEKASISIAGQNLVKDHVLEYNNEAGLVRSGLVKRSVYGKVTWQF